MIPPFYISDCRLLIANLENRQLEIGNWQ